MLGLGIGEIILIVVVAIIVLGPDKLPNAIIEIAKVLRVLKKAVSDAKETLDREVNLAELKKEANDYKQKIEQHANIEQSLKDNDISKSIENNMNDIRHLFQDYQPKPMQLDSVDSSHNKESIDSTLESKKAEISSQNNVMQQHQPLANENIAEVKPNTQESSTESLKDLSSNAKDISTIHNNEGKNV